MTPEEQAELTEERDFLRKEVASLTEQVQLLVRAEHALTRSQRVVDRQLQRIRRLAAFSLEIAGSEAPEILENARRALLDFFALDAALAVRCNAADPRLPLELGSYGTGVEEANGPAAARLLDSLRNAGVEGAPASTPRVVLWVVHRSPAGEPVALLVAWTSRTGAHHLDLPGAEHLPFVELFGSHVTRALDNAALTAELRNKNQELSASLGELGRAQAQLLQSQKLEAIGRLSAGIAHDFNNILTAIVVATDSLRGAVATGSEAQEDLETVIGATRRGTEITRRLLAFGRQQEHKEERVDLNALVTDLSRMLRRLIDRGVTLELGLDPALPLVRADPVQLEQIIMNLVINARDAMPNGGSITVQTRRVPREELPPSANSSADMVSLRVIDTGTGFDESIRGQLFDPFFTTKPVGKGTGLGLASVYGLVNQNKGHISVHSVPGEGAEFTVFLPIGPMTVRVESLGGAARGTVLIAEDEQSIRRILSRALRRAGFEVHEARDGLEALELGSRLPSLDLLVSDVVMPNVRGPELVRRLRAARPALPVVFVSGHTFDSLDTGALDPEIDHFLQKPFTAEELRAAVEKMLAAAGSRSVRAAG